MDSRYPPTVSLPSQLFTVRIWVEKINDRQNVIRIQVKHIMSGMSRTFREWSQVEAFITDRLQERETGPPATLRR